LVLHAVLPEFKRIDVEPPLCAFWVKGDIGRWVGTENVRIPPGLLIELLYMRITTKVF
jgi:hypothetical protein